MHATMTEPGTLWFIDNLAWIRVEGAETGGAFDLVEVQGRRGDMPPLHAHHETDEAFIVLEGRISLHQPGRSVELGPGETFLAAHGIPHVYRVESGQARWLAIGAPGGFADFVREASDEPAGDGYPDREPDVAKIAEAAVRHGIELLGPPGAMPS
jgi:mannose-6-phosphate isomerase-like protein (cupin superfamily)